MSSGDGDFVRKKLAIILAVLIMGNGMPVHADMILAKGLSDSGVNLAVGDTTENRMESAENDEAPESEGATDLQEPKETEASGEIDEAEKTGIPVETEKPAETEEPTGTEEPAETEKPTETEMPVETEKPAGTEAPVEIEKPTETETPKETKEPTGTETPVETEKPTEPETPAETKEPTDTEAPVETEKPTGTGTPVGTEEPINTEAPIETVEPIQTDKPTDTTESMESPEENQSGSAESVEGAERGISDITEGAAALSPEELNCIYNVSFPANTTAYFDPDNLSGKGQVFSNPYTVENYGNTDVAIKIKNIDIEYNSTETIYEFGEEEAEDSLSNVKRLHINMVWVNESENTEKVLKIMEGAPEEEVLVLRAAEYDEEGKFVSLKEGGTGAFYFTGTVEASSGAVWEDGEVTVRFDYEIVNADNNEKEEGDNSDIADEMTIPESSGNIGIPESSEDDRKEEPEEQGGLTEIMGSDRKSGESEEEKD